MGLENTIFYHTHPEDEWFDEIRLESAHGTVLKTYLKPRYKTSGLSGDEWRVSAAWYLRDRQEWKLFERPFHSIADACIGLYPLIDAYLSGLSDLPVSTDFYRKGHLLYQADEVRPLLQATGHLPWQRVVGENWGRDDGVFYTEADKLRRDYCFQPGCSERAVSTYRLKMLYSREGYRQEPRLDMHRRFCLRHLRRGDCGLEDADVNYEVVEGPGPSEAVGWEADVRESM